MHNLHEEGGQNPTHDLDYDHYDHQIDHQIVQLDLSKARGVNDSWLERMLPPREERRGRSLSSGSLGVPMEAEVVMVRKETDELNDELNSSRAAP